MEWTSKWQTAISEHTNVLQNSRGISDSHVAEFLVGAFEDLMKMSSISIRNPFACKIGTIGLAVALLEYPFA
jgi:hypothetical protein